MAAAGAEVRERHPISAADARIHLVDLADEAVRREPLRHRIGIKERPIHTLGRRAQYAVKPDGIGRIGHVGLLPSHSGRVPLATPPIVSRTGCKSPTPATIQEFMYIT